MLKKNKGYLILTGIITLLPILLGILLWNRLPETMATHFGSNGEANGWSSRGFAVFGLPLFLLAIHALCASVTAFDPRRRNISDKMYHLILWICPVCSLFCGAGIYTYALGLNLNFSMAVELFIGLLFIIIGNYLPKCRQNYTVGIKLPWTLADEENWNRTHRLAGFIWVPCGIIFIINSFLQIGTAYVFFILLGVMVLVPAVYSFVYYQKNKKNESS